MDLARYRKALVALVGVAALFIPEVAGMEGDFAAIYDGIVGILTAAGVFAVKNEPEVLRIEEVDGLEAADFD